MGIRNDLQKKIDILYKKKKKKYLGKGIVFFYIEMFHFITTGYWDFITKYWPGVSKWNTPFDL